MAKNKGLTLERHASKYHSCWIVEEFEEKELQCPACGCPKIVFIDDKEDLFVAGHMYLGKKASCYECGHEFVVTENCWKISGKWDADGDDVE